MPRMRLWTDEQLEVVVANAKSYRSVIKALGLVPAGGNYVQIQAHITKLKLDTTHFTGQGWNVAWRFDPRLPTRTLEQVLVKGSGIQSYQLKKRLFAAGIKTPYCELCGWAKVSEDGRIPLELDHINGDHSDNRLENLRILCPNCHSMQPTHRGKNKKTIHARMS